MKFEGGMVKAKLDTIKQTLGCQKSEDPMSHKLALFSLWLK